MIDKEKVKQYHLQGLNSFQIAQKLNCKPSAVRKCIERNLKKFRNSHLAAKIANREIDKVTKYECKQFMGDSIFIKKNRSIYKTDLEGNIIINNDVAPVVTFDTPRRLKNENSKNSIDKRIRKSNYRKGNILFNC